MTDRNDITQPHIPHAQSFGRALNHWRRTLVIVPLGALVMLVAVTVMRHRLPHAAQARSYQASVTDGSDSEGKESSFVCLPQIPGRHDRITEDFFVRQKDSTPTHESTPSDRGLAPAVVLASADPDALHSDLRDALQLKAIMLGPSPCALINDELVTLGDTVPFDGFVEHEYKVVAINENSVVLMWGTAKTVLQIVTEEK